MTVAPKKWKRMRSNQMTLHLDSVYHLSNNWPNLMFMGNPYLALLEIRAEELEGAKCECGCGKERSLLLTVAIIPLKLLLGAQFRLLGNSFRYLWRKLNVRWHIYRWIFLKSFLSFPFLSSLYYKTVFCKYNISRGKNCCVVWQENSKGRVRECH